MEAQFILKRVVRRVCTGSTISITNDPWLPSDDSCVHTDNEAIRNNTIDTLMIRSQCVWDVDVIKDVFLDRDAQFIMSIPLRDADLDRWFWKWDTLVQYTVKSAYTVVQENKQSSNQYDRVSWKKLWNFKISLKIKHFIWKAARNILRTKDNFLTRRVDVIDRCLVCNDELKTVFYVLIICTFVKQCWNTSCINAEENNSSSFNMWLNTSIQNYNTKELREVLMICWSLLKIGNELV